LVEERTSFDERFTQPCKTLHKTFLGITGKKDDLLLKEHRQDAHLPYLGLEPVGG